jgi:hypothetical protein
MLTSAAEATLANMTHRISDEQRQAPGQSVPLGDTGDGNTDVPAAEQGISNRPGDRAAEVVAEENEDDEEPGDDEEEDDDEDVEDDDLEDEEDEEDETTDQESEPGKPV